MMAYILTIVIMINSGTTASLTTITQEYQTQEKCEIAKAANREALREGKVILATCTKR